MKTEAANRTASVFLTQDTAFMPICISCPYSLKRLFFDQEIVKPAYRQYTLRMMQREVRLPSARGYSVCEGKAREGGQVPT